MWSDSEEPYEGKHYQLGRTLNSPQNLSGARPFLMIGGSGERKTLRLVAQYATACNIFPGPEAAHKLDVLRGHCERLGRDYDEIEKTTIARLEPTTTREQLLESLRGMHELGFTAAYVVGRDPDPLTAIDLLAEVVPEIAGW